MNLKEYKGLYLRHRIIKRFFDITISIIGIVLSSPIVIIAYIIAMIDTKSNGFFVQKRVGKDGKLFYVIKIKTMKYSSFNKSTVTTKTDSRITASGLVFRKTKIDELPQLINVLVGQMSLVGPRPDVPGYADQLKEEDRIILLMRPGITGPATLKYRNEEEILSLCENPEQYNREVIYPDKVAINKEYIRNYSFIKDLKYILKTVF